MTPTDPRRQRRANEVAAALLRLHSDESGQSTAEYASITTIFLMGGLGMTAGWPFTRLLFEGLQAYVDLFFYSLNIALG